MTTGQILPDEPLKLIRRCVSEKKIFWTYHVNMRLKGRFIAREAVTESCLNYEIIESYPGDKYLPSYLVRSEDKGDVFHILFAVDVAGDNVRIITAYRPDPEEWNAGFRSRRRSL